MDRINKYQYIAFLVAKERLGVLNEAERRELQQWLAEDPHHRHLYEHLQQKNFTSDITKYRQIDVEKGLQNYRRLYTGRSFRIYRWASVAAVLMVLVGSMIFWPTFHEEREEHLAVITPGSSKAELILGDGSVRRLENRLEEERIQAGKTVIYNTGTLIQYTMLSDSLKENVQIPVYNELRIPTGGEYRLILADGTKVWLNSQSRLKYPVAFNGRTREVELEGEAYFEVAHDTLHPFLVCLKDEVRVEVLGTSFNVRAYSDEEQIETVLEQGAVRVFRQELQALLKPGMKNVYFQKDQRMRTDTVDTELYTAWRNGQFVFQSETVENILHRLSRWYGMHVFYRQEEAKQLIFSGSVRKYETIQNLLNAMEMSGGIRFEVKGNTVVVSVHEFIESSGVPTR